MNQPNYIKHRCWYTGKILFIPFRLIPYIPGHPLPKETTCALSHVNLNHFDSETWVKDFLCKCVIITDKGDSQSYPNEINPF